jgi:dihydropteroate synthase
VNKLEQVSPQRLRPWYIRDRCFEWGTQTYLMGILNVTPDSFSDGGQFSTLAAATAQAQTLTAAGMDILDIGGQSTRPNAQDLALEAELERAIPVIQAVRRVSDIPISIDTTKAAVAEAAVLAGADIVNDVSGATYDPKMLATVAQLKVPLILMHLRGTPQTMQQLTHYDDLIRDLVEFFKDRVMAACAAGIASEQIAIDPGLGFAKAGPQNVEILGHLDRLRALGHPVLVGPSRKSFIGQILNQPDPTKRVWGTAAVCCAAIASGADILRVHDGSMYDVCRVADAIWRGSSSSASLLN